MLKFAVVSFDTQAGIETEWTKDSIKYPTGVGNYSGYNKRPVEQIMKQD